MDEDDKTIDVRFSHLYDSIVRVESQMREGFGELKHQLDMRLDTRDRIITDHEKRLKELEIKMARQGATNAILSAVGGVSLAGVVSFLLNRLLTGGS